MAFSTFIVIFKHQHQLQNIFIILKETTLSINAAAPHFLLSHPQATTNLLSISVSMNVPVLVMSYLCNHTICGLSCLIISLSIVISRFIPIAACINTSE